MIEKQNATLGGVLIAIDRQEKGNNTNVSAVQQVSDELQIPVVSIVTISHVIEYLKEKGGNFRRRWQIWKIIERSGEFSHGRK